MTIFRRFLSAFAALALALCALSTALGETAEYDRNAPQNLLPEHLFAESALLVDEDSGEVLFSKNSRVRMFPASTTKIMTLMLALESGIPLDSPVTIPAEAADIPEGSSVIPVMPGDVVSFADLLYGFMLSSGNDGANAIAVLVDGSIPAFVEHMNRRAAELGCEGTHYVNAHGYHDPEHYTTAQDLALMSRIAMENPDFRKIVAAAKWTMTIRRDGKETSQDIISRNSLLQSGEKYYYPECTGIKTGHHNKAGWCFVGSAERNGMRVICVVLNCAEEMSKWYDAARLFEYGFTRYEPVTLSSLLERARNQFAAVRVEDADAGDPQGGELLLDIANVQGGEQAMQVVSGSDAAMSAAVQRVVRGIRVDSTREMRAPVAAGETLGTLSLEIEGYSPVTADLTASRDVAAQPKATNTPRPVPTEAEATERESDWPSEAAKPAGGRAPLMIVALIALLALVCVAAALYARQARIRREREAARRRRRRQAQMARRRAGTGASARASVRTTAGASSGSQRARTPRRR